MERLIDITQLTRELSNSIQFESSPIELENSLIELQSSPIQLQCSLYVYN